MPLDTVLHIGIGSQPQIAVLVLSLSNSEGVTWQMWVDFKGSRSNYMYRQTSNISRTKSQNWIASHLILQLSLPNPLKPRVTSRMKMSLEQRPQPMLQLHLSDQQFYCLLRCVLYYNTLWWISAPCTMDFGPQYDGFWPCEMFWTLFVKYVPPLSGGDM